MCNPTVSFAAIEAMWDTFNNVADGFGINCQEFQEVCCELGTELDIPKDRMDALSEEIFKALDTDEVCLSYAYCTWLHLTSPS